MTNDSRSEQPTKLYRVTHCKRGHEYTPENTWMGKTGNRLCRGCMRVRAREYGKSEEWREYHRSKVNKYDTSLAGRQKAIRNTKKMLELYPEKHAARAKLRYEVKVGRIIKPEVCDKCNTESKIEGHHEDYSKPLSVDWLCRKCHTARHTELKGAA